MPTLTRQAWWPVRGRRADAYVAAALAVVIVAESLITPARQASTWHVVIGWALVAIACGALLLRTRYPIAVAITTMLASAVYYPLTIGSGLVLLTFVVALYTVAAEGNVTVAVIIAVITLLAVVLGEARSSVRHIDDIALFMLAGWLVAVVAVGAVVRNRRAYLREAARVSEDEARHRAVEERLRIARELHDVIGHHISLINVQAGAALHRIGKDPGQAEGALAAIKETSREALRELRSTLGVLRQVDEDAPVAPAPSLAVLPELLERSRASGLDVRAETTGAARDLPTEVDLAAYRIVQEALTNVTRHSGAASAVVRVEYGGDHVRVTIEDDGVGADGAVPGHGMKGMAERARALGGDLAAGSPADGGFRVSARLPFEEEN